MTKVLLNFIHPALEKSRINQRLLKCAHDLDSVRVNDLYQLYPDFQINAEAEKAKMEAHDSIVFQFPLYWYSSPALLKEWFDITLQYGWAYGRHANALVGKKTRFAVSTGAPGDTYTKEGHNGYTMEEFLRPMLNTCQLCGMSIGDPFYVHSALHVEAEEMAQIETNYKNWLQEG